jgi:pimeloyl-ACP methyl ester carboxylesterase
VSGARVGLVAVCLSIAGVAGVAPVADAAPLTAATPRPAVHWDPCQRRLAQARCGHIEVALDPSDASLGEIAIGFELYPRTDTARPSLGTIVAMEGGPGYATTSSRAGYLDLYRPLRDRRDVLLMDARGTGLSRPIDCVPLQSYLGNRIARIGLCGQQLGAASDVYGTAFVADDLAHVLDALGIDKIDLYGDSWGTFFSQTFAIRHPDRVRTLVLDSSYPVVQHDPWYRAANSEIVDAFRLACERSPACASLGGDPIARIETLDNVLRAHPLHATTTGSDGKAREITVDPPTIATIAADAGSDPPVYRELDGAARAYLDPVDPDPAPLLRLVSENEAPGGAGVPRQSSEGEYDANVCNDYPQLWDVMAPIADRPAQYAASLAYLHATDPNAFFPFTISDWTHSAWTEYRWCIQWPVPSHYVFPVVRPVQYPNVPTLVLSGDLDSVTWPLGGRTVAREFPDSTFVSVANRTHVTAVSDFGRCTSVIVVRFVAARRAGDTSCAAKYSEVRMTEQFPRVLADAAPAPQGHDVHSSVIDRKLATVVSNTVADVFPRWYNSYTGRGYGLRGGSFTYANGVYSENPAVRFRMKELRWTDDVSVSGTMTWDRVTGLIDATIAVSGPGTESGSVQVTWNNSGSHATATVRGRIGGRPVDLELPAS